MLAGATRQLGPCGPTCANKDRGLAESDPLPGPVLQTAAQNDQLCAAELEITNQATAAPVPGQGAKAAEANTWAGCTGGRPPPKSGRGRDYRLAIPGRGKIWAAWPGARRGLGCPAEWSP